MSDANRPNATPARQPTDLAGWLRLLQTAELPVLARTAEALEGLRVNEDEVDARALNDVIATDPLMTLKLLGNLSARPRTGRLAADVETVTEALVLIGITPFFTTFGPQPTVEQALADCPDALAGLNAVVRRAHRAAQFALAFAVHRGDHDAAVIHEAALLCDFAEMLLWLHAPDAALAMQARQLADPTLRSVTVQRATLGVSLAEIQHALMEAWRLPELLVRITDERHQEATQVRNVLLAIRVARHTAKGWTNPAIPDDIRDVARLLNLDEAHAEILLKDVDG
jgi:HD-like signal output (HDOD) protein